MSRPAPPAVLNITDTPSGGRGGSEDSPGDTARRGPLLALLAGTTSTDVTLAGASLFAVWMCLAAIQCLLGHPLLTPYLGGDFSQFYIAGKILREYGAASLYDVELQSRMFRELHAAPASALWFVYSPVLAVVVQPLSLLPFPAAYALWCALQVCFYISGLAAAAPLLAGVPANHRRAVFAMTLAFLPFCGWSLIGGQTCALAFVLYSWAIRHDLSGHATSAGLILALCTYKPSLLAVIIPCLVIRANFQLLLGFAAGLIGSFALTASILGPLVFVEWAQLLMRYARFSSGERTPWPQNWPHLIDLNHFLQRLGFGSTTAKAVFVAVAAAVLCLLLSRWRFFDRASRDMRQLVWATTLTVTLLINAYTMTYDAISATASFLLTLPVAYRSGESRQVILLGLGIWGTAMIPTGVIAATHVQWFTIAIGAFAVWQSRMMARFATAR